MATLPSVICNIFRQVDLILHAGDVDEREYLAPLQALAPVYAVRGNPHPLDLSWGGRDLPWMVELNLLGHQIVVVHGHQHGLRGWLTKIPELMQFHYPHLFKAFGLPNDRIIKRLKAQFPKADVIIFGHTHTAHIEWVGNTLFFNPGGVTMDNYKMRSVGLLWLWEEQIVPKIVPIDHIENRQAWLKVWACPTREGEGEVVEY